MFSRPAVSMAVARIVAVLALFPLSGAAGEGEGQKPRVSLSLESVHAERGDEGGTVEVIFDCRVAIVNDTGAELKVRSNFYSIYDGLELVIFSESGEKIVQQPYTWHQSPHSFREDRAFPVARGANRAILVIPVRDLKPETRKVKVQMVGVLPGSDRSGLLVSGLVDATIVPKAARGPLPSVGGGRSLDVEYRDPATNQPVTFTVPGDRWETFLDALTPVRRDEHPATWEALGTLRVVGWDDNRLTIHLYRVGKGPGAFSVESAGRERTYYRGGSSDALLEALRSAREAHSETIK